MTIVGGVIRMHLEEMVASYSINLKGYTNNQAEGMALLWWLKITLSIGLRDLTIVGNFELIIDVIKGLNGVH